MWGEVLWVIVTSFLSCTVGVLVSLLPMRRMIERKFENAQKEAKLRLEFRQRRERISDEAIQWAMKIIFWLRKGCRMHDPVSWNGELDNAVKGFEEVEARLLTLNAEIVEAFKSDQK